MGGKRRMSPESDQHGRQGSPLGVGIIGCGAISALHAATYSNLRRRARLIAFADVEPDRAIRMKRLFHGDAAVLDYADLLERTDIDVISVCTPASTHAQIVLDAIHAGKHVLCEKPIATSMDDVDAIIDAASESPELCVSCVFQHRDDPALRQAHWVLGQGLIGNVSSACIIANAHRTTAYYDGSRGRWDIDGGGALMVQGIHLLDAMTWLLGRASLVSGTMTTSLHDIETEDTFAGWARLTNGARATISCTTCSPRDEYTFDILGDHAGLHLRYRPGLARTWELRVQRSGSRSAFSLRHAAKREVASARKRRALHVVLLAAARASGSAWRPTYLGHGPHIRRFLDAVELRDRPPVTPREARRSVELALAFYRSASTGQPVTVGSNVMARDGG